MSEEEYLSQDNIKHNLVLTLPEKPGRNAKTTSKDGLKGSVKRQA